MLAVSITNPDVHVENAEPLKFVIYSDDFLFDRPHEMEDARSLGEDILGWIEKFGTPLKVEIEVRR